jgi:CxxC-x17-CxxC domain-containing protein
MGNYQGGGGGGGNRGGGGFRGGNGGGRPSFRGGDRGEVTMHKAVCDECKKSCEVPFRPSGDKPVYCSDCFSSKREDGDRGGDRGPRRDFGDRAPKRDFNDRPAPSFAKQASVPSSDAVTKQLSEISTKLDRLTSAIEKLTQPKVEVKSVAKTAPVVAKVEVKKAPISKVVAKKVVAKTPAKKVEVKKIIAKKKTK